MVEDKAFRSLYESSKDYCLRVLRKWTANESDAEEVFAEALSIYWIRLKQAKIKHQNNVPAYICTIAINLYKNRMKASSKIVDIEQTFDSLMWVNEQEDENPAIIQLRQAFKKLGEDCQQLLTAKYVYGYKYEEIAVDMGRSSANSLKVQTFRCTKYLMKLMKNTPTHKDLT